MYITLQNGALTISREHKVDQKEERGNYHVGECYYDTFRGDITLLQGTDKSKIRARIEDGALEVAVEGIAIEKVPKHIEIEGPSGD